jgi:uncharacterized protein (DUF305 family)
MRKILAALGLVVLFTGGCARSESESTVGETSGTTVTETSSQTSAQITPAQPYDLQFIDTMIAHHKTALEMSSLVKQKGGAAVKKAAEKMSSDQQRDVEKLQNWRNQWHPGAPDAHNMELPGASSMNMDMSHMQSMSGHQFDDMFVDMMIPHHQGAIAMSQDALQRAEHVELKQFAQEVIDKQQKEIAELRRMKEHHGT